MTSKYICAGGYVLSLVSKWKIPFRDIDLFMEFQDWKQVPLEADLDAYHYKNFAAIKNHGRLQYIYLPKIKFDPISIISTFDLTICQMALHDGKLYMTDDARDDFENEVFHVIEKNIRATGLTYRRVRKYERRGFKYKGFIQTLDDIVGVHQEVEEVSPFRKMKGIFRGGRGKTMVHGGKLWMP